MQTNVAVILSELQEFPTVDNFTLGLGVNHEATLDKSIKRNFCRLKFIEKELHFKVELPQKNVHFSLAKFLLNDELL
jgi:hypothetical protein